MAFLFPLPAVMKLFGLFLRKVVGEKKAPFSAAQKMNVYILKRDYKHCNSSFYSYWINCTEEFKQVCKTKTSWMLISPYKTD